MMLFVAHRGASADAPENTLAAVRLAWEQGADAVEIDIHWTRDRQLAVIHDPTTRRTGRVRRRISRSLWRRLADIDVGLHRGESFRGERIPLLSQVLALVPPGKRIFIEIKGRSQRVEELDDCLTAAGKRHQAIVMCFNLRRLAAFKRRAHDVQTFWLRGPRVRKNPPGLDPINRSWLRRAVNAGLDGLSIFHRDINPALVACLHEAGMQVNGWTVRTPEDARRLAALGVDSITADSVTMAREAVRTAPPPTAGSPRSTAAAAPAPPTVLAPPIALRNPAAAGPDGAAGRQR
ncbi:MAG: glycerophosphodiester phosphodiesterase [Planctomycetota bacterium]